MTAPDAGSDSQPGAEPPRGADLERLEAGAVVEVMNPFTGEWRNGFVVLAGEELGHVLGREDSPGARTPPIPRGRERSAHPHR